MDTTFLLAIEIIGTIAFAISGIRLAAAKNFDWFGAYTVGLVTAIGGGTTRDLLLNTVPFWMQNWMYIGVTGLSLIVVITLRKYLVKLNQTFFIFDTIGLGLFVVIGIQKSLEFQFSMWVAIIMGVITGAIGGVIRDILINEEPLIFRKDVYATACIAGGLVYWIVSLLGGSVILQQTLCASTVIIIRIMASRYNWSIPVLRNDAEE